MNECLLPLKLVCDDAAGGDPQDAAGAPRPPRLLEDPDEQIDIPAAGIFLQPRILLVLFWYGKKD